MHAQSQRRGPPRPRGLCLSCCWSSTRRSQAAVQGERSGVLGPASPEEVVAAVSKCKGICGK